MNLSQSLSPRLVAVAAIACLITSAHAAPTRILCLGDHITHGTNAPSFRDPLIRLLYGENVNNANPNGDVYDVSFVGSMDTTYLNSPPNSNYPNSLNLQPAHEGHSAWTSGNILNGNPSAYEGTGTGKLSDWLSGYTPDIVLLHIGSEDAKSFAAGGGNDPNFVANTRATIGGIIDTLHNANPAVAVFLAKIIPPDVGGSQGPYARAWVSGTNAINGFIDALAAEKNTAAGTPFVTVVDQFTGFDPATMIGASYATVPNSVGEAFMAARWFTAIKSSLHSPPPPPLSGVTILELGDSITQGGAGNPSYREPLIRLLKGANLDGANPRGISYPVTFVGSMDATYDGNPTNEQFPNSLLLFPYHEGHGGWTAAQLVDGNPGADPATGTGKLSDWLTLYTPDVVLLHIGTNDASAALDAGSSQAFANIMYTRIGLILDALRQDNPNVFIYLAKIVPRIPTAGNYGTAAVNGTNAMNAMLDTLAADKNAAAGEPFVFVVDQNTGFDTNTMLAADHLHPNVFGGEFVAHNWFEAMKPFLDLFVTPPADPPPSGLPRVMILGDDITQGGGGRASFRDPLIRLFRGENVNGANPTGQITNLEFLGTLNDTFTYNPTNASYPNSLNLYPKHEGHSGWSTSQILNGNSTAPYNSGTGKLSDWLSLYTPDVVFLHLGTVDARNYAAAGVNNIGPFTTATKANMGAIIDALKADNPNVTVFLAKIIPGKFTTGPSGQRWAQATTAINNFINTLASEKNTAAGTPFVFVVDQSTGFNVNTMLTADTIHPNPTGEAFMAARWYAALQAHPPNLPIPVITSATTTTGTIGHAFSFAIVATNNPTSYSAANLPPGLTINTVTGNISGTPTAAGTFSATIYASNGNGAGQAGLTITVSDLLTYALGLSGDGMLLGSPTVGVAGGGQLTMTFDRLRSDVTYTIQASSDLASWTDLATNPGSVGGQVTVTDLAGGTSSPRFLRLRLSSGSVQTATLPDGIVRLSLPAGSSSSYLGNPLTSHAIFRGPVTGVSGDVVTVAGAPFSSGALAQSTSPYWLRVISGAQAGRYALITSNTANSITVNLTDGTTQSVALDAASWAVAAGDIVEVAPADTLSSLFGGVVTGGTSLFTADTISLWEGTRWVAYYFSTSQNKWLGQLTGSTTQDNHVLRPDEGWVIARRAGRPALSLALFGSVPEQTQLLRHPGAGVRMSTVRFPVPQPLSAFAYQGPGGWASATTVSSADTIGLWNGARWLVYWRRPDGQWRRDGDATAANQASLVIQPGQAIQVTRRTSAAGNSTFLSQPLPYSDPRQ